MQYMLMFHETPADFDKRSDPAVAAAHMGAWRAYIGAMMGAGIGVNGAGLLPPHTSTTVRVQGGKRQVQDGPFADTKEQLGGYFVIDVPSLDDALEWAARSPSASSCATEVRPLMPPMPPMPD